MHNSLVKLFLMGLDMPYTLNQQINKKTPICTILIYYCTLMTIFKIKRKKAKQKMWPWRNKPLWTMKFLPFSLIHITISGNLQLWLLNGSSLMWGLQKEVFKSIPCLSSFNYLWHYLLLFSRNLLLGLSTISGFELLKTNMHLILDHRPQTRMK